MDVVKKESHILMIEAILAFLHSAKATPMLIRTLCLHGQKVYIGQYSQKVTATLRTHNLRPHWCPPAFFALEGPLLKGQIPYNPN